MMIALAALAAETRRNPLRKQLAGAGGAAGSPEYNPYVAALSELELVTHRRIYRVLYQLNAHVGNDLSNDRLWKSPDQVDQQPL